MWDLRARGNTCLHIIISALDPEEEEEEEGGENSNMGNRPSPAASSALDLDVQQAKALVDPTNDTEDGGGRRMAIISIARERARARDRRGGAIDIIARKKMLRCMFFGIQH